MAVVVTIQEGSESTTVANFATTFTEEYLVEGLDAVDPRTHKHQAATATGIPAIGDAHPADSSAVCVRKRARAASIPNAAIVAVEFSSAQAASENPLLFTTGVVEYFHQMEDEKTSRAPGGGQLTENYTGNVSDFFPLNPNAADPFTRTGQVIRLTRPVSRLGIRVTRRETTYATIRSNEQTFANTINAALFGTWPAKTLLCSGLDVEQVGADDFIVRWLFDYRAEDWDHRRDITFAGRLPTSGASQQVHQVIATSDFSLLPITF